VRFELFTVKVMLLHPCGGSPMTMFGRGCWNGEVIVGTYGPGMIQGTVGYGYTGEIPGYGDAMGMGCPQEGQ